MRAATEESAVSQALMIVGAARDEVSVEVIEQSDKGVTVRVSPRAEEAPAAVEAAPVDDAPAEPSATEPAVEDAPAAELESIEDQVSDAVASEADDEAPELASEPVVEAVQAEAESQTVSMGDSGFEEDAPSLEQVVEDEAAVEPFLEAALAQDEDAASTYAPIPEEVRERACTMAQSILDKMGLEASAALVSRPFSAIEEGDPDAAKRVYVAVDGRDVSILIGKHGATLHAFQYLLNLSLNNRGEVSGVTGDDAVRVVVDAGGYRARRAEMLERMAQETASRAKRESRSLRMESMPAHERRLVHMFLRQDSSITTGSEGREPQRYVVVAPAGMPYESPRSSGQRYGNGDSGRGYSGGRGGYSGNRRGRR
jgi:spoIIIJ-associated protein